MFAIQAMIESMALFLQVLNAMLKYVELKTASVSASLSPGTSSLTGALSSLEIVPHSLVITVYEICFLKAIRSMDLIT